MSKQRHDQDIAPGKAERRHTKPSRAISRLQLGRGIWRSGIPSGVCVNRIKSTLARLGIRDLKPTLRKAHACRPQSNLTEPARLRSAGSTTRGTESDARCVRSRRSRSMASPRDRRTIAGSTPRPREIGRPGGDLEPPRRRLVARAAATSITSRRDASIRPNRWLASVANLSTICETEFNHTAFRCVA